MIERKVNWAFWAVMTGFVIAMLIVSVLFWNIPVGAETRVDLFDAKGNRTGYATIDDRTGRVDRFDTHGRREGGYGIIDQRNGRVDVFDSKGQRKGYGTTQGSRGGKR
jgi:hypothetical protein